MCKPVPLHAGLFPVCLNHRNLVQVCLGAEEGSDIRSSKTPCGPQKMKANPEKRIIVS